MLNGISSELMIDMGLCVLWSMMLAIFAIPSIIRVSHTKKLLDLPNERTVHLQGTPRLGGLAIFAGFISAIMIFGVIIPEIQRMIASCLLLFFIGVKDDIVGVSAFKKFFIQFIAAGLIVFLADIRITDFQGLFGLESLEDNISYGFTLLTILMITNAINLLDGLDGLAGTISLFILLLYAFFFITSGQTMYVAYGLLCISLAGGILGFLRFNFYKASIFMGDTGSLLIGFVVAAMSIEFVELKPSESTPAFAVAVLIVPVFDTLRVFALRILKGQSPFSPDRNHLHHILMMAGLSQVQVVLGLLFFNALMAYIFYSLEFVGVNLLFGSLVAFLLLLTGVLAIVKVKTKKNAAA